MALEIMRDPRLESVAWRDLVDLAPVEVARELAIYLPWLLSSWALAHLASASHPAWFVPALGASFLFFLCGLRQVHNAFHLAVGVSARTHEWLIVVLSPLMMSAMHAVQWNHLRHHRYCMDDEDIEAQSAHLPAWQALLCGPLFPFRLHRAALTMAPPRVRRFIVFELLAMGALVAVAVSVPEAAWLRYHVVAMCVGQCFAAFFAVWTVHHDCDRSRFIARTLRSRWKNIVSYNMFFHVEHHLFPAVPTCHLPELAERLDRAAPELRRKNVW